MLRLTVIEGMISMRMLGLALLACFGCGCTASQRHKDLAWIHFYDPPASPGGFSLGIAGDGIRVIAGGQIVAREDIEIIEIDEREDRADPNSTESEYLVRVRPSVLKAKYGNDIYVLCTDLVGNLIAFQLPRRTRGKDPWKQLSDSDAEELLERHFRHLRRRVPEWRPGSSNVYELEAARGGFSVKDGKVHCGFGGCTWVPHLVTGNRLEELKKLGLESVSNVEAIIWGTVDRSKKTIDIEDYKVLRIFPGRKMSAPPGRRVTVHLHDDGSMPPSSVDPETIFVAIGGRKLPRKAIEIAEIKDPAKKADPGSPYREFLVRFDASAPVNTYGTDVNLFYKDQRGDLRAARLVRKPDQQYDWELLLSSSAENLHRQCLEFPEQRRKYYRGKSSFILQGVRGGFLVRDGKVHCGWGGDIWDLYRVTGNHLTDLERLGLQSLSKVEALVWATGSNETKTVDVRDYKILKIYPKTGSGDTQTIPFP